MAALKGAKIAGRSGGLQNALVLLLAAVLGYVS